MSDQEVTTVKIVGAIVCIVFFIVFVAIMETSKPKPPSDEGDDEKPATYPMAITPEQAFGTPVLEKEIRPRIKRTVFQTSDGYETRPIKKATDFLDKLTPQELINVCEQVSGGCHWIVVYHWDIPESLKGGNP